jgi:hypothetical protein
MKSLETFLSYLNEQGVNLHAEGEQLRCHAPKGALTSELRTELAERKIEILQFLQTKATSNKIQLIVRNEELPLSFSQQRLWFLDQLEGENAIYNMPAALRLEGSLNHAALEQAFAEIVQRHETLRTTFTQVDGKPVPVIHQLSMVNYQLPIENLDLPPQEQERAIQKRVAEEAGRPFDLAKGPLFRTLLLQLEAQSYVLMVTMHHIISDAWSIGVLVQELSTLYEAFSQGKTSSLSPLPVQYVDFAYWQRQWLSGERYEKQLSYWQEQLAGVPALLQLPTDRPRPPIQRFQGATVHFQISSEVTLPLKTLSQQNGTTLFMTLLAVFATLLSRYSGQSDIVIGSPLANRSHRQIESLIGLFVNTLVLRINLADNPRFDELLGHVRQVALDAYAHQDIPFEQLIDELQLERSLSHTPLFQVMFLLENAPQGTLELSGLTFTSIIPESSIAKFDLTLSIGETEQGLAGILEYNTDLFERATIERMATHFQTLLRGIVKQPLTQIQTLSLLTEAEERQLLQWNNSNFDYPVEYCLHQLFETQVERYPEATAVIFEEQRLSYALLNQKPIN